MGDREATGDALGVGKNEKAMKTLRKQKDWGPPDQVIVFSENAQKVNEKFKHQTRLLLVTNLAVFNVRAPPPPPPAPATPQPTARVLLHRRLQANR